MTAIWQALEPTDQDMEYSSIWNWMIRNIEDHRDPVTGEINCTSLAEDCALTLYPDEILNETHKVWDIAVDVSDYKVE